MNNAIYEKLLVFAKSIAVLKEMSGVSEELEQKTPFSKYVWKCMDKRKQEFIIGYILILNLPLEGLVAVYYMRTVLNICKELGVAISVSMVDDKIKLKFPDYGIV